MTYLLLDRETRINIFFFWEDLELILFTFYSCHLERVSPTDNNKIDIELLKPSAKENNPVGDLMKKK